MAKENNILSYADDIIAMILIEKNGIVYVPCQEVILFLSFLSSFFLHYITVLCLLSESIIGWN
jgi:hypothetical protein